MRVVMFEDGDNLWNVDIYGDKDVIDQSKYEDVSDETPREVRGNADMVMSELLEHSDLFMTFSIEGNPDMKELGELFKSILLNDIHIRNNEF